jgi:CheY-like chemotaxis protein
VTRIGIQQLRISVSENPREGFDAKSLYRVGALQRRIREILLVSSPYDAFIIEEGGLLAELISSEFAAAGLGEAPQVTRVLSGQEALKALATWPFDLVITMLRVGGGDVREFARDVQQRAPDVPIVLIVPNELELVKLRERDEPLPIAATYVWHGDPRLFMTIVHTLEDAWAADAAEIEHGMFLVVDRSVRHLSMMLPLLHSELIRQAQRTMRDGLNSLQRMLKLRARPKILIATSLARARMLYEKHGRQLVGVIADFAPAGSEAEEVRGGIELLCTLHAEHGEVPTLLYSGSPHIAEIAMVLQISHLPKHSPTLMQDMRSALAEVFGFGDFVFREREGGEIQRVNDLREFEHALESIPESSLRYHAPRRHFSTWVRARGELSLAAEIRAWESRGDLSAAGRAELITALRRASAAHGRGNLQNFDATCFDGRVPFVRIGGGSIGGKARGLVFLDQQLARLNLDQDLENVRISIPRSVSLGTDLFDDFLTHNGLRTDDLYAADDQIVRERFLAGRFPDAAVEDLRAFANVITGPLAVRSSSLLEDSQYHPFAGVYQTRMLINSAEDLAVRLEHLQATIKLVYASMFYEAACRYLDATGHRIEEQKMAIVLQSTVGARRGDYFYPDFSGVVRSFNFYPVGPAKPEDGVAMVALGLGEMVVQGGAILRFCPAYPNVLPQMALGEAYLDQSQRKFLALDVRVKDQPIEPTANENCIAKLSLSDAEEHNVLQSMASTWSPDNGCWYDGANQPGVRAVTFAPILKYDVFPLAKILQRISALGADAVSGPVEMEFACNLSARPREFAVLQMRPYGHGATEERVQLPDVPADQLIVAAPNALGNGVHRHLRDVVFVRPESFDAASTRAIAFEVARINENLRRAQRQYVLIGPGRWGSSDHWLGIPVGWGQISAARVIIEAAHTKMMVDPSQGSHFFHNLATIGVAYLTLNERLEQGFVAWDWLNQQHVEFESEHLRHVSLTEPMEVRIDGRRSRAAIYRGILESA